MVEERDTESRVPNVDTRFLNLARRPRDYQIYFDRSSSFLRELATMAIVLAAGLTAIIFLIWVIRVVRG